ncbi:MAG: hypothetical protein OQL08_09060 [Gammaproteobacteria bacterium]|nr:hypothetical protein [Gammaproteobacteria bacterium]
MKTWFFEFRVSPISPFTMPSGNPDGYAHVWSVSHDMAAAKKVALHALSQKNLNPVEELLQFATSLEQCEEDPVDKANYLTAQTHGYSVLLVDET